MSLLRKSLEVFTANWVRYPLGLLANVIVIRVIGAEGKGVVVLLMSVAGVLSALGHLGMPAAAIYYLRKKVYAEGELIVNFLIVVFIFSLLMSALFWLGGNWFYGLFFEHIDVHPWLIWLTFATIPVTMVINFITSILLGAGLSRLYAGLVVGKSVLYIVAVVLLVVLMPFGIAGAIAATILAQLIALIPVFFRLIKLSPLEVRKINRRCISDMFGFGIRHYPSVLAAILFNHGGNFLLGLLMNVQSVGYYSVAVSAYNLVISIPRAVNTLLTGEATARMRRDSALFVARSSRNIFTVMFLTVIALSITSPWWVPFLYGDDFSRAVMPVIMLSTAALLAGVSSSVQTYFFSINRPGLNSILNLLTAIVALGMAPFLISFAEINGMAVSVLTARFVGVVLILFVFQRLAGIPFGSAILVTSKDISDWHLKIKKGMKQIRLLYEML